MPLLPETLYRSHVHRTSPAERRAPLENRTFPILQRRVPTHAEIAELAYAFWEARGRQHGDALQDWLRAERELRQRYQR